MPVGEVYFIQEFPNPNEEPTKLVKIGLVGKEGGSEERLRVTSFRGAREGES
jgi:hypothetical protein